MWGHEPGTHDGFYKLPGPSRMTPLEAAVYLDVPNMIMIGIDNRPAPPFDQYMISFRPLKRVAWSVVGDASSNRIDVDEVVKLAAKYPNLCAGIMDDFFHAPNDKGEVARVSVDDLKRFRAELQGAARPLELWATTYAHDLGCNIGPHLEQCHATSFWTWTSDHLPELEEKFEKLEAIAPGCRVMQGLYMWDYGASGPMPLEMMQHQCRLGLEWLHAGRVDGLIFLSNSAMDHDEETPEWTRQWIREVGSQRLAG